MHVLGLRPKFIVWEARLQEISEAIQRYLEAGKEVPVEWLEEYIEIVNYLEDRKTMSMEIKEG